MKTLLELLQAAIERTYRMDTGILEIERHVVGDLGLQRIYAGRRIHEVVGSRLPSEPRVLVRDSQDGIRVNIYYPDELIAVLERRNPLYGLDGDNLDPFAVFVEELDHFLTIADRARAGRRVRLFDLELHANVTKYVAARHFLERSRRRPLHGGERQWLRWRLFELQAPREPREIHERYRRADRLGRVYTLHLDRLGPAERLAELRRFHRLDGPGAQRRAELGLTA